MVELNFLSNCAFFFHSFFPSSFGVHVVVLSLLVHSIPMRAVLLLSLSMVMLSMFHFTPVDAGKSAPPLKRTEEDAFLFLVAFALDTETAITSHTNTESLQTKRYSNTPTTLSNPCMWYYHLSLRCRKCLKTLDME